jgi:hypothetical protein
MSVQSPLLTPTQLSTHLACAHYTRLERKRLAGELKVEFTPDPRLEAMRARRAARARLYRALWLRHRRSRESRDPRATLEATRQGARVIVQALLGNEHFRGVADVLLRVGNCYESVDTKLASETRAACSEASHSRDSF